MPKGGRRRGGTAHIDVRARAAEQGPSRHLELQLRRARDRDEARAEARGGGREQPARELLLAFSRVLDMSTTQDTVFETVARAAASTRCSTGTTARSSRTARPAAARRSRSPAAPSATSTAGSSRARSRTSSAGSPSSAASTRTSGARAILSAARNSLRNSLMVRFSPHRYEVRISYLEIYLEAGYDLLDPSHETKGRRTFRR